MKIPSKLKPFIYFGLITLVILILYRASLWFSFLGDDFLEIKYFSDGNLWQKVLSHFWSKEWGYLPFYRPVAVFLHAVVFSLSGINPLGYHLANIFVHILNAFLVYFLANELAGNRNRVIGFSSALIFAVHPLQINTVAWAAAFASGYGTLFIILSSIAYINFSRTSRRSYVIAALLFFIFALGSYEAAFMLPLLLVSYELIINRLRLSQIINKLSFYLPAFFISLAYLAIRRVAFGGIVSGYPQLSSQLAIRSVPTFFWHSILNLKTVNPVYSGMPGYSLRLVVDALIGAAFVYAFFRIIKRGRNFLSQVVFCFVWVVLAQLTFIFAVIDPATSRVLSFFMVGFSMGLVFMLWSLAQTFSFKYRLPFFVIFVGLFTVYYSILTFEHMDKYKQASNSVRSIQEGLVNVYEQASGHPTLFFQDYPAYVTDKSGRINLAVQYQVGMSDAVSPPFTKIRVPVYPLPRLSPDELKPLLTGGLNMNLVYWDTNIQRVKLQSNTANDTNPLKPVNIEAFEWGDKICFKKEGFDNFKLVVLTEVIPSVYKFRDKSDRPAVCIDLATTNALQPFQFYKRNRFYWWVLAFDDNARVAAASKLNSFLAD